jgi:Flp pilus assembly protein CpaB
MKNFVPLIMAVLLGLAAVLAVGRLLKERREAKEKITTVVAAAAKISAGDILTESSIMEKPVPVSAKPEQAIPWSRSSGVVGQRALRSVVQGDYLLLTDVAFSRSMGAVVGEGEWAVTMRVAAGGISRVVQPGDQVAVVGTFRIKTRVKSADLSAAPEEVAKEATLVLFPRVRVLDVGAMGGKAGAEGGGQEIMVSLPPRQAQILIAAQRKASLTLALRRPGDDSALSRVDAGMVDEETFDRLLTGLESVDMPVIPDVVSTPQPGKKPAQPGEKPPPEKTGKASGKNP